MNTPVAYRDCAGGLRLRIKVLEELFHFISFEDWINAAQVRFRNHGHAATTTICVDRHGLVCVRGKQFKIASYPVRVYAVDEAPYKPSGMIGPRDGLAGTDNSTSPDSKKPTESAESKHGDQ